jgi:hypothetical protein
MKRLALSLAAAGALAACQAPFHVRACDGEKCISATIVPEMLAVARELAEELHLENGISEPSKLPALNPEKMVPDFAKDTGKKLAGMKSKYEEARKRYLVQKIPGMLACHMTIEDMKATIAFIRSPAGRRVYSAIPKMNADLSHLEYSAMQAGMTAVINPDSDPVPPRNAGEKAKP